MESFTKAVLTCWELLFLLPSFCCKLATGVVFYGGIILWLLDCMNRIVWGVPALLLILGVGVYFSFLTGFLQIRLLPRAIRHFVSKFRRDPQEDGVSAFQALCTALAATVGTGNLVGVAGAIAIGGPGSIFWMWVCALSGMVTKFAEATLAVHYRIRGEDGYEAGPMYLISEGLGPGWRPLADCYCLFGMIAAFGVGNAVQIRSVMSGLNRIVEFCGGIQTRRGDLAMGAVLAVLVGAMLLGGAKRIGQTAELLMPAVAGCYMLICVVVLILRADAIPGALWAIVKGAFSPRAVTGGVMGSWFTALRVGVSRGVFTNEAGLGTASMAHGCANVRHPAEQGLMGIMEVFLDTIVICTLTALAILCSGVTIPYGKDAGVELTLEAFSVVLGPWVAVFLALSLCCFAFATVLGWGLYGARCARYLFGPASQNGFAILQTAVVFLSALMENGAVWSLAETVNGLMAIPNLIALVMLSPRLRQLAMEYELLCGKTAAGGTYESFNQRESLPTFPDAEVPPSGCGSEEAG